MEWIISFPLFFFFFFCMLWSVVTVYCHTPLHSMQIARNWLSHPRNDAGLLSSMKNCLDDSNKYPDLLFRNGSHQTVETHDCFILSFGMFWNKTPGFLLLILLPSAIGKLHGSCMDLCSLSWWWSNHTGALFGLGKSCWILLRKDVCSVKKGPQWVRHVSATPQVCSIHPVHTWAGSSHWVIVQAVAPPPLRAVYMAPTPNSSIWDPLILHLCFFSPGNKS